MNLTSARIRNFRCLRDFRFRGELTLNKQHLWIAIVVSFASMTLPASADEVTGNVAVNGGGIAIQSWPYGDTVTDTSVEFFGSPSEYLDISLYFPDFGNIPTGTSGSLDVNLTLSLAGPQGVVLIAPESASLLQSITYSGGGFLEYEYQGADLFPRSVISLAGTPSKSYFYGYNLSVTANSAFFLTGQQQVQLISPDVLPQTTLYGVASITYTPAPPSTVPLPSALFSLISGLGLLVPLGRCSHRAARPS